MNSIKTPIRPLPTDTGTVHRSDALHDACDLDGSCGDGDARLLSADVESAMREDRLEEDLARGARPRAPGEELAEVVYERRRPDRRLGKRGCDEQDPEHVDVLRQSVADHDRQVEDGPHNGVGKPQDPPQDEPEPFEDRMNRGKAVLAAAAALPTGIGRLFGEPLDTDAGALEKSTSRLRLLSRRLSKQQP
jgi:hypothetical protein